MMKASETSSRNILIVEDDSKLLAATRDLLTERLKCHVVCAQSVSDGMLGLTIPSVPAVVLTDLGLGDGSGLDVLRKARGMANPPLVIILTGQATLETAVEALRLGAFDYLQKPYEPEHLLHTVRRAFEARSLHERVKDLAELASGSAAEPVAADPKSKPLLDIAARLAVSDAPVLISGESGVGKEVYARYIHAKSRRDRQPFVAINCAAIPGTLLEAELFGYEKGAFSGASDQRKGKFELASGGTMFLDEIGELPLDMQPKLLRVLDGHGFLRLGGQALVETDVRIVAATNRDLEAEVRAGRFREDLFFRLTVGLLQILPLRQRPLDIVSLAESFITELRSKYRRPDLALGEAAYGRLQAHTWPGNARELKNTLERAALMETGPTLTLDALTTARPVTASGKSSYELRGSLPDTLWQIEKELLARAVRDAGDQRAKAARALGISKQLLNYKLRKFGME